MRLSNQNITLATKNGAVEVPAFCSAHFGLHYEYHGAGNKRGQWKVTHLPSGMAMHTGSCSKAAGRAYIELLEAVQVDWGQPKDELGSCKSVYQQVKAAREQAGIWMR